jgi:heme exporter protein CcmD
MKDHAFFITIAYLATFLGCGVLVVTTLMRLYWLRKRLKQLSDDQIC